MIITIQNDYSYLATKNVEVTLKLCELLKFRQKNYYHTRAYQNGTWDGYIWFMSKTGKFLTGLLPEVEFALTKLGYTYTKNDERKGLNFTVSSVDENFLQPWKNIVLHDYQVDLINQVIKNKRGIVKSPTASGKTFIMIAVMKALPPGTPLLFLVNRKSLVTQNYKEMKTWGFDKVGCFYGDKHEPNLITCATVQSLHHLDKLLPKFRVVIVDEIHMLSNNSGIRALKKLKGCDIRIAVSATPFKFGEKDKVQKYTVKGFFGPIFSTSEGVLTTNYLQKRGNISDSICTFYPVDEPKLPYDLYIDAVTNGIANNFPFHKLTSKLAMSLKGRTLIIVERLIHGDMLNTLIPGSLWIQGKDNEDTRNHVIEQLKVSKINTIAIATNKIFDVGVNIFTHNLINAAGGKAEHDIIQRMGRGLRNADDKDILRYYDFIFRINPYLEDHSKQRINILKKEKHEVIIKNSIDF